MRGQDVYVGFQFSMPHDWYIYGEGKVCTVVKITDEAVYWKVGDGVDAYYNDVHNFYYDDSIFIDGFEGWFVGSRGIEHLSEPNWEV